MLNNTEIMCPSIMEEGNAEDGWYWSSGRKNSGKKVQVCLQFLYIVRIELKHLKNVWNKVNQREEINSDF